MLQSSSLARQRSRPVLWAAVVAAALLLLVLGLTGTAHAASCGPQFLYNQADVDDFEADNPGCTKVNGDLFIGGVGVTSDIFDLSALAAIRSVRGDLTIQQTTLENLEGLASLKSVRGAFRIILNSSGLTSLDGLDALTSVGERIDVNKNPLLTDLNGLETVTSVGRAKTAISRELSVRDNSVLGSDPAGVAAFCGLYHLINGRGLDGTYTVSGNVVDPMKREIVAGGSCAGQAIENVITDVQAIVDASPGTDVEDKLEDVVAKLDTVVEEFNKTPPDNQAALGNMEGAVGDLEAAVDDGLISAAEGNDLMDQLAAIARQVTQNAINAAIAARGDAGDISDATASLAEGDTLRDDGAYKDAVAEYKDALSKAEGALP